MNRVEKRENKPADAKPVLRKDGAKLIIARAKDLLERMREHSRHKFGPKDGKQLAQLKTEIDEVLSDSDSPALTTRQEKPVWVAILPTVKDPCETGELYTLSEALLDCKRYLDSRLGG
jgi:hypothetical protein